ncbi:T9SS type A sorting domain-containing protein [Mesonia phycicola]|nr:T9SS type A sorting domain-containing protein [Mesonia phycicola]
MKKKYTSYSIMKFLALFVFLLISFNNQAQVTEIYTDYLGYWKSTSSANNSILPEDSHAVLAFTANGTTYSTGVNDTKLTSKGVSYTSANFRALPVLELPTTGGGSYYIGFGQLTDGIDNGTSTSSLPFTANPTGAELASYLTAGPNGLDLGTYFTNIPSTSTIRFELSSAGLDMIDVGDGIPDILVSQIAQVSTTKDELRFVDSGGNTVGNRVDVTLSAAPTLGTWQTDLFNFNGSPGQVNNNKTIKFASIELSEFGITASNITDAVALIYTPSGSTDPAFIAYNEPSIPVASNFNIVSQPTTSNCDGTLPSSFTIQVTDDAGNAVAQAGFNITANIKTGPGQLLGTLTRTTDASGQAVFDDLSFEVGGDHTIAFNSSSLKEVISATIADATSCGDATWNGSVDNDWNDANNWDIAEVPNANYNVTIPSGLTNYPILDINTGADNLILGDNTSIELNGHLFTIQGTITTGVNSYIDGSAANSELYMSGQAQQTIPSGFIDGDLANFTIENNNGVVVNTEMKITEILTVITGQLTTNGNITLTCDFTGNTAQIGEVTGSISGDITAEQCFPANRAYRFVSSSITTTTSIRANWQEDAATYDDATVLHNYGTHITGVGSNADGYNGFDYNPSGNPSMFTLNNSTQSWEAAANTTSNLTAGAPYRLIIRGDRFIDITDNDTPPTDTRLRATGTAATGSVTFNSGFNFTEGSFNFFGNPYHAIVDMEQVINSAAASNINPLYYYIWDPNSGTRGAYSTIEILTNTGTVGDGNNFLQPMQSAFFLTSNLGTTPSITFEESFKTVEQESTDIFRTANNEQKYLQLNIFQEELYYSSSNSSDGLKIKFQETGDNAYTYKDAPKLYNLDENIARDVNGNLVSIEVRNIPTDNETLQLFTDNYVTTNYIFKAELQGLDDYTVYLKDNYTNKSTVLSNGSIYSFRVDESISETLKTNRFIITFNKSTLGDDTYVSNEVQVYPNPTQEILNISTEDIDINGGTINIYDTMGRKVMNKTINENFNNQLNISTLPTGIYLFNLQTTNGSIFTQKIVKQ